MSSDPTPPPPATPTSPAPRRTRRTSRRPIDRPARSDLTRQLDREWRRLLARPSTLRRADRWGTGDADLDRWAHGRLAPASNVDDVVDLVGRGHGTDGELLLHWLVGVARTEQLAMRIVLQRLLPLLIDESSRWRRAGCHDDPADEAITAATIAVGGYDPSRFRPHVAPRLVAAAIHEAFRKPRRRRSFTAEISVGPTPDRTAAAEPELDAVVVVTRVLSAGAAAGVDDALLEVARRLARGDSTVQIAADHGCTDRAVRGQRARLVARLRDRLDDSWDGWHDPLTGFEFRGAA